MGRAPVQRRSLRRRSQDERRRNTRPRPAQLTPGSAAPSTSWPSIATTTIPAGSFTPTSTSGRLGDPYEGLLSFEADAGARGPAYDASEGRAYVPAAEGNDIAIAAGSVYLRGSSGGRKASGSCYTPQIVVRHVVKEGSVCARGAPRRGAARRGPGRRGKGREAAVGLSRLRSGDGERPLCGSTRSTCSPTGRGPFLADVAARPRLRAVLNQLRETVQAQARDLPAGVLERISRSSICSSVSFSKRSIYGVD